MSSESKIEKSVIRTKPCGPGCRHPQCVKSLEPKRVKCFYYLTLNMDYCYYIEKCYTNVEDCITLIHIKCSMCNDLGEIENNNNWTQCPKCKKVIIYTCLTISSKCSKLLAK